MAQSLIGAMDGLFAACQSIYATNKAPDGTDVLISYGDPGQYQPNAIVAVMDGGPAQQVSRPTMGTNRSREIPVAVAVVFSTYVPGDGPEVYQSALDCTLGMLRQLDSYFRTSPNETLGGACREAWVSAVAGPTGAIAQDNQNVPTGRVVDATAVVTIVIRY